MWSTKGDTVFSPFMGIGSEGFASVKMGRKFIGAELKESYWKQACENLDMAEVEKATLFDAVQEPVFA
jgi:DNA modification methylase